MTIIMEATETSTDVGYRLDWNAAQGTVAERLHSLEDWQTVGYAEVNDKVDEQAAREEIKAKADKFAKDYPQRTAVRIVRHTITETIQPVIL